MEQRKLSKLLSNAKLVKPPIDKSHNKTFDTVTSSKKNVNV